MRANAPDQATARRIGALPRTARSLSQQVAARLREAIVYGSLTPGERLTEEEIAAELDISRGPVREALRQLEQEGLVASYPNRATFVADISNDEVQRVLLPIRTTLETHALEHALKDLNDADFGALDKVVGAMESAAAAEDLTTVVELDLEFHEYLMRKSDQLHSIRLWQLIEPRIRGHFYRQGPHHSALAEIGQQHRQLLATLRTRDPARAIEELERHIADRSLYTKAAEAESAG